MDTVSRFLFWLHFLAVWFPTLLRHSSNSIDRKVFNSRHVRRLFLWVSRHEVYWEGWITEAKNNVETDYTCNRRQTRVDVELIKTKTIG